MTRRVRHLKRGTTYDVLGKAKFQTNAEAFGALHRDGKPIPSARVYDGDKVVVYRGEDGKLWARPADEFEDGRFEDLPPAASVEGGEIEGLAFALENQCDGARANALTEFARPPQTVDCRSADGVTIGLIDGMIAMARVLAKRDLRSLAVEEALMDLASDEDVAKVLAAAPQAAAPQTAPQPRTETCQP